MDTLKTRQAEFIEKMLSPRGDVWQAGNHHSAYHDLKKVALFNRLDHPAARQIEARNGKAVADRMWVVWSEDGISQSLYRRISSFINSRSQ